MSRDFVLSLVRLVRIPVWQAVCMAFYNQRDAQTLVRLHKNTLRRLRRRRGASCGRYRLYFHLRHEPYNKIFSVCAWLFE